MSLTSVDLLEELRAALDGVEPLIAGRKFRARDVNLVMAPSSPGASIQFRVFLDGQLATHAHGADVSADGSGTVRDPRTYQMIRQSGEISDRLIQIEFRDAGVEAYCFTFG
jgi:hypothetical protein